MKKNKKGFTLVELLAVIIVLIIVLLIAITRIRESKKRANEKAIEANALGYIKTINDRASVSVLEDKLFKSGLFSVDGLEQAGVKVSGKAPDTGLFCVNNYAVTNACLTYNDAQVIYSNGKVVSIKKGTCDSLSVISCSLNPLQEFVYTGMYETFTAPSSGMYGIELWGAQGGGSNANPGGKGGYTSGIISLNAGDVLYFYVGEKGKSDYTTSNIGSFNGGGYSGSNAGTYSFGGGGATDVRLVSGEWNNTSSLRSRIMIAGGGGGNVDGTSYTNVAGVGGNLIGGSAQGNYNSTVPTGGTQTGAGAAYQDARKGIFGSGRQAVTDGFGGGGGGGFWGGSNGHGFAGSGGSSYISGHVGSVAIANGGTNNAKTGCANGTNDIKCSYHYSGNYFSNTIMKSGAESMPSHDGTTTMVGNEGNGYGKIFKYNIDEPMPYSSATETFAYTGIKQVYNAPKSGNYMLEVWGAQGGSAAQSGYTTITGAYGGYSKGTIHLSKGDKLYVYVGGAGAINSVAQGSVQTGGFNGGGVNARDQWGIGATGGGATHIAKVSGVLSKLSNDIDSIIIVAGGGGAGGIETAGSGRKSYGGNGGGYIGNNASTPNCPDSPGVGGTQTTGAGFGQGSTSGGGWYGSAGGGFYGGRNGCGGGGGSGYIGNPLLTNKVMYCYNCSQSDEESTKTISVTCAQEQPTENCAKIGNGHAKISFID